jgi:hypothetical protein
VAQSLQRFPLPADDRLPNPAPCTPKRRRWIVQGCVSRALSLSLAGALCRQTSAPALRMDRNLACIDLRRFACRDIAKWTLSLDVRPPTASERTAPRRGYFFFLAATLRLAGAFFFAAVFAFVAFFTILPS